MADSITSSDPPTMSSSEQDMVSPAAYATLFTLSSVVLVLVITTACYNLLRSRPPSFAPELGLVSSRKPGLDEHALGAYPRMTFSEANHKKNTSSSSNTSSSLLCSICLADYIEADLVLLLPNCGHFFHVDCVDHWLRLRATCPMCRSNPAVLLPAPLQQ